MSRVNPTADVGWSGRVGGDEIDPAELDAFEADEFFGHFVDLADAAPQDDDFEAVFACEVNVHRRDGMQQVLMLKVGEFFHQLR